MKPEYSNQVQQNFVIDAYSAAFNQETGMLNYYKAGRSPFISQRPKNQKPHKGTHIDIRKQNATLLYVFGESESPPLYISDIANMYGVSRELIKIDVDQTLTALHANAPLHIQDKYSLGELIDTPVPKLERKPYVPPYQRDRLDPKADLDKRVIDPTLTREEAQAIIAGLSNGELLSYRKSDIFVDSILTIQKEAWGSANRRMSKYAFGVLEGAGLVVAERAHIVRGKQKGSHRFVWKTDKELAVKTLVKFGYDSG